MPPKKPSSTTFDIGLVMAGAVSAGAYTAGVLDYLLQALDAWYDAKSAGDPLAPPHDVNIKVASGASAGGICAALLTTLINRRADPIRECPAPPSPNNVLYQSWVEKIDISRLLETQDMDQDTVRSLLDVSVLDEIAHDAFSQPGEFQVRPYFSREFHVLLTVTNLRGVPYRIRFAGDPNAIHDLSLHADHMHFVMAGRSDHLPEGAFYLDPARFDSDNWTLLRQSALATSAFPGGLAPRLLRRPTGDYARRPWWLPEEGRVNQKCYSAIHVHPEWPTTYGQSAGNAPEYEFLCVDGGVMNNEPLELARRILAGEGGSNPREGDRARAAVLMIDPFPDPLPFNPDYHADGRLLAVLGQMFASLLNQARFKPDELALAWDEKIFSRYLIAPSRPLDENPSAALASKVMHAFGGFLHRDLRDHDFQLGRRNGQRFLQQYFLLPETNPLFAQWTEEQKNHFRVSRDDQVFLPIIPLMPGHETVPEPLWPHLPETLLRDLEVGMKQRADVVFDGLLPLTGISRWAARWIWRWLARGRVVGGVSKAIEADLRRGGLL